MQDGAREGEALLLAATHRARKLPPLVAQVVTLQQLLDAYAALSSRVGIDLGDKLQVLEYGHVTEKRELLGHVTDSRFELPRITGHLGIEDYGVAVAGHQQAAQHADCR